ncbi:hypothetical protein COY87_04715 [Candidatus Roizmanbacteria bacterium CG_4_10_14_0_8_um_filter_33_9]|uniref:Transcription regulator TrmB N-terminal domain-containing protein n=1 Tax=Candidatus Roizmanbacteria bacterium CG_4_10_14_0_8_um_filter_33_9 TaxID=1974826 RepID=A0A2M7QIE0_9BACT|nr:MAG: hypothetical protein COY87_04715 [Candidatus Roizmanbacteria bacterium CG_4_10_14_0_8_um_filter_33_9]
MSTYSTLSSFGLTKNEIIVYLEAIKHKEISPFKIARLTGIPRTTVYDVMMSLALKKLITIKSSQGLEKQQTWIVPQNPSVLREIIINRRKELTQLEVDIVGLLSDLKDDFLSHKPNADWQFFPGKMGISKVYSILKELPNNVDIYYFDHMMPMDTLGKNYINTEVSQTLKIRKGTKRVKTITPLNEWTRHVLTYQYGRNKDYIHYHEYRYIDEELFQLEHDMYVFLDKVIMVVAKDDEIWASLLTSKLVSTSFKSIFKVLWNIATPVTDSFVKELGENEFLREERKKRSSK